MYVGPNDHALSNRLTCKIKKSSIKMSTRREFHITIEGEYSSVILTMDVLKESEEEEWIIWSKWYNFEDPHPMTWRDYDRPMSQYPRFIDIGWENTNCCIFKFTHTPCISSTLRSIVPSLIYRPTRYRSRLIQVKSGDRTSKRDCEVLIGTI